MKKQNTATNTQDFVESAMSHKNKEITKRYIQSGRNAKQSKNQSSK